MSMGSRARRLSVAIVGGALVLTGCSGGDGNTVAAGGGTPEEVVATGLGARLQNGAAFSLQLDGDLNALSAKVGETPPPEIAQLFNQGLISGAFAPDRGVAFTFGAGDGFFQMRAVDEAIYLRLDLQALKDLVPADQQADFPSADALRSQLPALRLPAELNAVAEAALNGQWVGITGLSQEALQSLADNFGAPIPSESVSSEQQAQIRALFEEQGFLDGAQFTQRYLTISGDGPQYAVTVKLRALSTALFDIFTRLSETVGAPAGLGGATPDIGDVPAPTDVPETVSGVTITVDGDKATQISADIATVLDSIGSPDADIAQGDIGVSLQLSDVGNQLDVPGGATTIEFQQLIQTVMGALFSGALGS